MAGFWTFKVAPNGNTKVSVLFQESVFHLRTKRHNSVRAIKPSVTKRAHVYVVTEVRRRYTTCSRHTPFPRSTIQLAIQYSIRHIYFFGMIVFVIHGSRQRILGKFSTGQGVCSRPLIYLDLPWSRTLLGDSWNLCSSETLHLPKIDIKSRLLLRETVLTPQTKNQQIQKSNSHFYNTLKPQLLKISPVEFQK